MIKSKNTSYTLFLFVLLFTISNKISAEIKFSYKKRDTLSVFINANPDITPAGPIRICAGQSQVLTANNVPNGYDFQWEYSPNGNNNWSNIGNNNNTVTVSTAGYYTCTISQGNNSNTLNIVQVIVNSLPSTPSISANPNTPVCSGTPINFSTPSVSGITFTWDFNDGGSPNVNGTSASHTYTATTAGNGNESHTVNLTATNSNGCTSSPASYTVNIKQLPDATLNDYVNFPSEFSMCGVDTLQVTNSSTTASTNSTYTINWGDGSPVFTSTGANWPANATTVHTYGSLGYFTMTFTVTGQNGCTKVKTYTVYRGSNPQVPFNNPGSSVGVCAPFTFSMPSLSNNNPSGTIYIVNINDGTPPDTLTTLPPVFVHIFSNTSCGATGGITANTFRVSIRAQNPCGYSDLTVEPICVNIKPKADFTISPSDTVCTSTTVSFTNTSTFGVTVSNSGVCNYISPNNWAIIPATGWSIASGNLGSTSPTVNSTTWGSTILSVNFTTPGSYQVYNFVRNSCGTDTIVKTVCIQAPPTPAFIASVSNGCAPFPVTFTDASTNLPTCGTLGRLWTVTKVSSTCSPGSSQDYQYISGTSSNSVNPVIQFNNEGVYNVVLSLTNICGTFSTTPTVITVKSKPEFNINSLPAICLGNTSSPSASILNCGGTISTYAWTFTNGSPASSSSQTPGTISYSSASNTNPVSLSITNECGTTSNTSNQVVNPLPSANAGTDVQMCSGDTKTIGSTPVSGMTYNWVGVSGAPISALNSVNVANPSVTLTNNTSSPVTYTYEVTVTGSSTGCSKTDQVNVTVYPLPTATISGGTTICNGGNATLTITGTPGATVTYTNGSSSSVTLNASGNATVNLTGITNTTTYTLTGITANATLPVPNCTSVLSASTTVTVRPVPTATLSGSNLVCSGTGTTLTITGTPNTIVTYTINGGTNQTINIPLSGTATLPSTGNLTSSAVYQLVSIDYNSTPVCTAPLNSAFIVNIKPLPTATISGTTSICTNSSANITFSGTPGATVTYTVSTGTPSTSTVSLVAVGNATVSTGTLTASVSPVTYTLVSIISNGVPNCSNTLSGTAVVTVTATPSANISYPGLCSNQSTPVSVIQTGSTGGTYSAPTGLSINTSTGAITPSTSTVGTYTVTYSVPASGGCAAISTSTSVTITQLPTASISYSGSPYCKSLTASQAVSQTGTTGGTYSATPAGLSISSTTGAITPSTSTAGTYTVTYTIASAGGCNAVTATATVVITAVPNPAISYAQPFCNSVTTAQSVTLTGTTGGSYSYTGPVGSTLSLNTTNGDIVPSTSTPGTYTVTYTVAAAAGCAAVPVTAIVTITQVPTATISYNGPYCTSLSTAQPVTLNQTGGTAGTFSSTIGLTLNSSTGAVTPSSSTPGNYTVTYTIPAAGGCAAVSAPAALTITSNPTASITYNQPFCSNDNTTQVVNLTGAVGGTYAYTTSGSGTLSLNTTNGQIVPSTSSVGTYTITYTIPAGNGCNAVNSSASVTINQVPSASISYPTGPYCSNDNSPKTVTITGTSGGTFSSSPSGLNINSTSGAITPQGSNGGTYTITYTIAASGGCGQVTANATVVITTLPTPTISYPGSPFCTTVSTPQPVTQTGTTGGTYSAIPAGLTLNQSNGEILPSTSSPGTYTVTYTLSPANGCGQVTATTTVTITRNPSATISYSGPYCTTLATAQQVVQTGTLGGTYTSAPAGLSIDANTGAITPSTSTPGNYTVTYTIAAAAGCQAVAVTATLSVVAIPTASISYSQPFCSNDAGIKNVTLTGTTGGTYNATPAGLSINSTTGDINPSLSSVGTYTVTYSIVAANGCAAVTANATVVITQVPAASIAYPVSPYCSNDNTPKAVTITGTTGGTFSSTPAGLSLNPNTGDILPSSSSGGTYVVTYTIIAGGGCNAVTDAETIVITTLPSPTISYAGSPFCNNLTTPQLVTQTGPSGGTYTSTPVGLSIDANTGAINPSASTPGSYTVTYTLAPAAGCGTVTTSTTVTVTLLPNVTISYNGPYCTTLNSPQPIVFSGTAGGSYTVLPSTGLTINSSGDITPSSSTPGNYVVTYTIAAAGGCPSVSNTAPLSIVANPTANISYPGSPFCTSITSPQPVTFTGNVGGIYSAPVGLNINPSTGEITPSTSTPGNYTVTYTIAAANGCAAVTATTNVTITLLPAAAISYNALTYCNSITNLENVNQTGTTGGVYTVSPSGLSINASTGAFTPSTSNPGVYTVTYTIAAAGGCAVVAPTTNVTIFQTPVVPNKDTTICNNNIFVYDPSLSFPLTAIVPAGTTYTWAMPSVTPSSVTVSGSGMTAASGVSNITGLLNHSSPNPVDVNYVITPTAGNGCVGNNFALNVTVNSSPTFNFNVPSPQTICSGTNTSLVNITSPTSGASITWNSTSPVEIVGEALNGGNTIPVQTIYDTVPTPASITYNITASNTTGAACAATTTYVINVNPTPVIHDTIFDICSQGSFSLTPVNNNSYTIIPANTTYTWSVTNNPNVIGSSNQTTGVSILSQTLTNNSNTIQTVVYTVTPTSGATGNCVGNPFTVTVNVNPTPVIQDTTIVICSGSSFSIVPANLFLPNTIVPSGTTYAWSLPSMPTGLSGAAAGNNSTSIFGTLVNSTFAPLNVVYTVTPTSGLTGNCIGSPFNVTVVVNPLASINNFPLQQTICNSGTTIPVVFTSYTSGATYSWQAVGTTSVTGFVSSGTGDLPQMTLNNIGLDQDSVLYSVTSTSNACSGPPSIYTIYVNPDAKANYTYPKDTACWPFSIVINNTSPTTVNNPNIPNSSYQWYSIDNSGNSTLLGISTAFPGYTIQNPSESIDIKMVAISAFGCKNDSVTHSFYTKPNPAPSFTASNVDSCGPLTVSFHNTTALLDTFQYHWNFGNAVTSNLSQPNPVTFLPNPTFYDTVYYVVLQAYNECNSVNDTIPIRVKSKPKAQFAPDNPRPCSNSVVNFINTTLGVANNFEWHFGDNSPILTTNNMNPVQHVYNVSAQTVFHDTLVSRNDCGEDTAYFDIIVTPITIQLNFAITPTTVQGCAPHQVEIHNVSIGGALFTWNFNDPLSPQLYNSGLNTETIFHTYAAPGVYNINVHASNACSDTSGFRQVKVLRTPIPNFSISNNSICIGQNVQFNNLTDTATTYAWDFGDGTTSVAANPTHIYNAPGVYTVTLSAVLIDISGTACPKTITHTVTIVDHLPGDFNASAYTGNCTPFTVQLSNLNLPSANTTWDFGDGSFGTGDQVSHTYTNLGTYQVHMHVIDPGGCMYDTTKTITVGGPYGTLQYTGNTICGTLPVRLDATAFFTDSIRWNFGDGTFLTTTSRFVFHTYLQPGIYRPFIELISGPNGNCRITIPGTTDIKVDKLISGFDHNLTRLCDSTKISLTDTSFAFSGIQSWSWNFGDGSTGSGQTVNHYYTSSNTYNVTGAITSNWGCTLSTTIPVAVTLITTPSAQINGISDVCSLDTLNFISNINSVDPINLIKWEFSNGQISYGSTFNTVLTTPGNYTLYLIAGTVNGCYDTASLPVVVYPKPTLVSSTNQRICLGQSVQLNSTSSINNYQWSPLIGLSCFTCPNPVASPQSTTEYIVNTLSAQGCKNSDTIVVTVIQPFTMTLSSTDTICIGESSSLTAGGADNYQWTPASSLSCSNCPNPIASPDHTTQYMVTGYDNYNCFSYKDSVIVAVGQYPTVSLPEPQVLSTGTLFPVQSQITNGPIRSYEWTPANDLSCSDCSNPTALIKRDVCYKLEVENIYGCKGSDDFCIRVFCENTQVFIPNAFTPEGNGVNDVFMVRGVGISSVKSFRVYNRWGQVVFERNNFPPNTPAFGWDGKVKGVMSTPDVFVYTAEVLCENNESYTYKGNVTLIR